MMMTSRKGCLCGAASVTAILALLASAGTAHASGFQVRETSGTLQGSSYAGMSTLSTDASTIFYNPANVGHFDETSYSTGASLIIPVAKAKNINATNGTLTTVTGGPSTYKDMAQDALVPNAHAVWKLNEQINLGVSIASPWGLVTDNDADFAGRFFGTTSKIKTINIKPVAAYRFENGLSIGAGPQIQHFDAALSRAVPSLNGNQTEGNAKVSGDDVGYGWTAGMNWQLRPDTRLGIAYNSEIHHELEGDIKFDDAAKSLATPYIDRKTKAKVTTPEAVAFGVSHDLTNQWTVMADTQWTNWNSVDSLVFRYDGLTNNSNPNSGSSTDVYNWGSSWFGTVGARYQYDENWAFTGGVAFDESPVTTRDRNVRLPDSDRYWVSLGMSYKVADWTDISLGYTHVFAKDARVDHGTGGALGRFQADYEASVDIIALQANFKF
ncbi:MAG: outer membrane protein transport protein [Pseudomonadota bacterium]